MPYGLHHPDETRQPENQPDPHDQHHIAVRFPSGLRLRRTRERRPQPERADAQRGEQPEEAEAGGAQTDIGGRVAVQPQPGVEKLADMAVAADGADDGDDGRRERGQAEDREDRPEDEPGGIPLLELLQRQYQQRPPDDRRDRQQPQQQHPVHSEAPSAQLLQRPAPVGQQRRPVRPGADVRGRRMRRRMRPHGAGHRNLLKGGGRGRRRTKRNRSAPHGTARRTAPRRRYRAHVLMPPTPRPDRRRNGLNSPVHAR
jgi:hypothetical protein